MNEEKLKIFEDLLVDESHSLEDLKRLVEKSKNFIKIEQKTGKILISYEYPFTIRDKIILTLIGKYFCSEMGFEQEPITSRLISEELNIQQTSLSGTLGNLEKEHIISKNESTFAIKYYQIEKQLSNLYETYIIKTEKATTRNNPVKHKISAVKKNKVKNSAKQIKPKKTIETQLQKESESNIELKIKKENLTLDELHSVFNVQDNKIYILKGHKTQNIEETHIRSTLLAFVAMKIFFNTDEMNSSFLRETLQYSSVGKLTSLSTKLKNYSSWIIHKRGQIGCTNTSYRILPEGYLQGLILLKDIINNTSQFQLKLNSSRMTSKEQAPKFKVARADLNKFISEFARIEKIDESKLKIAFDFQEDHIRIIEPIKENTRKIMQIKNLLILGYLIKKVYQEEKFDCKKLLKDSSINSDRLDLLNSNKAYKKYFSVKKSKTAMSLIYAGEIKAKECLAKYLNKEVFEL